MQFAYMKTVEQILIYDTKWQNKSGWNRRINWRNEDHHVFETMDKEEISLKLIIFDKNVIVSQNYKLALLNRLKTLIREFPKYSYL